MYFSNNLLGGGIHMAILSASRGEPDVRNKGLLKFGSVQAAVDTRLPFDDGLAAVEKHWNEIKRELIVAAWREQ